MYFTEFRNHGFWSPGHIMVDWFSILLNEINNAGWPKELMAAVSATWPNEIEAGRFRDMCIDLDGIFKIPEDVARLRKGSEAVVERIHAIGDVDASSKIRKLVVLGAIEVHDVIDIDLYCKMLESYGKAFIQLIGGECQYTDERPAYLGKDGVYPAAEKRSQNPV